MQGIDLHVATQCWMREFLEDLEQEVGLPLSPEQRSLFARVKPTGVSLQC